MRNPVLEIRDNLMWTRSGTVWALWQVRGLPYGYRAADEKRKARALHTSLIRNLPGESLWLGVCAGLDPIGVVERMLSGVDVDACPDWAAECAATLDTLEDFGPGERIYVLAVPLAASSFIAQIKSSLKSAETDLRDALALPRTTITPAQLEAAHDQARRIREGIPGKFDPQPMSPAQMVWLSAHAAQRGLFRDTSWPAPETIESRADRDLVEISTPGTAVGDVLLDEGGQSDVDRKDWRSLNPLTRRYVKVESSDETTAPSYQVLQVMTDVPPSGSVFPGCEVVGRIDESALEVDWAMRLTVKTSDEVRAQNARALAGVDEQMDQRAGEVSTRTSSLGRTAEDIAEYVAILENDKLEVEAQATFIFATAAAEPDEAVEAGRRLSRYMSDLGYRTAPLLGHQMELWWAMTPGVPTSRVVREFAQITTSTALATTVPFASTDLGDDRGSLLAWNISSGRTGVVLHDIAGASARDMSGSIAIAGELGSGKSVLMKSLAGDMVDRGGVGVALDRTQMGEWETWARSITDTTVVNIDNPDYTLDPLRNFGPRLGSRVAQSFLVTLLNLAPNTLEGAQMTKGLSVTHLQKHQIGSLGAFLAYLRSDSCEISSAEVLADRISMYAEGDFGDVLFNPDLEPLPKPADLKALVIRTHTLELPTKAEIENKHLYDHMRLEKWFGRAVYTLCGGLAREICFEDRTRLGGLFVDECYHLTGSPEGEELGKGWVRDGRKHNAAVVFGGHDPAVDFGSETLRGLIPTRIQMRQRDPILARSGLDFIGLDPNDEDLVDMLVNETSPIRGNGVPPERRGEAFMRDAQGRIGRIKVQAPLVEDRFNAVLTSPVDSAGEAVAAGTE